MKRLMLWLSIATSGSALFAQGAVASQPPKTMPADAVPQFDVATIKPSESREPNGSLKVNPGGTVNVTNFPVMVLLTFAYNVPRPQISGGPSWLETERFDIVGKPGTAGAPNMTQLKMMIQKLLADRFQLTVHRQKKELPIYALTVAKGGPKLVEDTADPNGLPKFSGSGGPQGRKVQNATMEDFATDLRGSVGDRLVVDQTGLGSKRYDLVLKWSRFTPATNGVTGVPPGAENADAPADIFAAIQQQLGLKLVSTKAPVDVIVIDRVEKPSEN